MRLDGGGHDEVMGGTGRGLEEGQSDIRRGLDEVRKGGT